MKYLRLIGIAIFAICALSATMVSTANATSIAYTGGSTFTISAGKGHLETSDKLKVECESATGNGKLGPTAASTAELTVSFKECETVGKPCTSTGAASGEIKTNQLTGKLGKIKTGEAGVLLSPTTASEFILTTSCGTIKFKATKSVIGNLTPVGTKTKALTATFAEKTASPGLQAIKSFEGESTVNNLNAELGRGPEEAVLVSTVTLTLVTGEGTLTA